MISVMSTTQSTIDNYQQESRVNREILVHTDPGNDIDDEIAAGDLIRELIKKAKYNVRVTFSVKTKDSKRLIDFGIRPFTGLDLDPTSNTTISLDSGNMLTITFHDGTTFLPTDYTPDYIVNIAPGLDSVVTEANLVNLRGFSHQGLPSTWKGFNDIGSVQSLTVMLNKGVPHAITTPFESFANLFSTELFEQYEIPESARGQIPRDAFKMIMGRMPPTVPTQVLPMAESLVNIPYAESIGKPASNSRLALAIRAKLSGHAWNVSPDYSDKIRRASIAYVDSLIAAATNPSAPNPIKHYEQTIQSVFEMTYALAEMNMPTLNQNGDRLIYSSDGDLANLYPDAFEEFKKIGIFTPAYDLIAVQKLYTLLEADGVF
jgi:hypothetical protein